MVPKRNFVLHEFEHVTDTWLKINSRISKFPKNHFLVLRNHLVIYTQWPYSPFIRSGIKMGFWSKNWFLEVILLNVWFTKCFIVKSFLKHIPQFIVFLYPFLYSATSHWMGHGNTNSCVTDYQAHQSPNQFNNQWEKYMVSPVKLAPNCEDKAWWSGTGGFEVIKNSSPPS